MKKSYLLIWSFKSTCNLKPEFIKDYYQVELAHLQGDLGDNTWIQWMYPLSLVDKYLAVSL